MKIYPVVKSEKSSSNELS